MAGNRGGDSPPRSLPAAAAMRPPPPAALAGLMPEFSSVGAGFSKRQSLYSKPAGTSSSGTTSFDCFGVTGPQPHRAATSRTKDARMASSLPGGW
jgi:hypothetical protein